MNWHLRFDMKLRCALPAFLFVTFSTTAQYAYPSLKLTHFTDADGLSNNDVNCMMQDHLGFIWIGTADGLNRFDGESFVVYKKRWNDSCSLQSNIIDALVEDADGRIWIGTDRGLCWLEINSNKIHRCQIPSLASQRIKCLLLDQRKILWIGVKEYVYAFNLQRHSFQSIRLSEQPVYQWSFRGSSLCFDHHGGLYAGGWDGVYSIDTSLRKVTSFIPLKASVASVKPCDDDHIWVCTWGLGILILNTHTHLIENNIRFPKEEDKLNEYMITIDILRDSAEDGKKFCWVPGNRGILIADITTNLYCNHYSPETGNSSTEISTEEGIFEDRDHHLWFWTDKGFSKLDRREQLFREYDLSSGNITGGIQAIIPSDTPGEYYVALFTGVIILYDISRQKILKQWTLPSRAFTPANAMFIYAAYLDTHHRFWVSTPSGGLYEFNPSIGFHWFKEEKYSTAARGNAIFRISEDRDNHLWLASKAGLEMFDPLTRQYHYYQHYDTTVFSYLGDHRLLDILIDRDQQIWCVSHADGIFIFNPGEKKFHRVKIESPDGATIKEIKMPHPAQDTDGTIWLSTEYGLFRFDAAQDAFIFVNYSPAGNLIDDLFPGEQGNLWIISGSKISVFNPHTNTIKSFGTAQGLADEDARYIGKLSGRPLMYITYRSKFILFNPDEISSPINNQPVRLIGFRILEEDSNLNLRNNTKAIRLKYSEDDLRFDYRLLDYGDPRSTQYAYKLDGLDDRWNNTGSINSAIFTHLHEGNYKLLVKAANADGIWSAPAMLASFAIATPYWRTNAFRASIILFCAFIAYAFYVYRRKQHRKLAAVREHIARDLHDDVGSTLSSIRMTSALARKKISEDRNRAAELLDKINDSSARMTENMQDIVWAVNPANDSFERIIARMQQFAAQSFEAKNIELQFSAGEEMKSVKLPLQHRRDFYLIYKEAVNNVSKYSNAQHGMISLSKNHHILQLKIEDDGIGFREDAVLPGNGLRNMRDRAKKLNGSLHIHSEEGKGTTVILEMKI